MALLYYTTREAGTTYCVHKYLVDSNTKARRMQAPTSTSVVTEEHCWAIAKSHEMPRSFDGDGGVEIVAVLLVIVNCEFDTRGACPL